MIYIEPPRGAAADELYRWGREISEAINRIQEEYEREIKRLKEEYESEDK